MVSVQVRKEQAEYAIRRGLGQRRSCTLFSISRSSLYYRPSLPGKDAPILARMRALSGQYPRFGYRRIRIFLAREGVTLGRERCFRLWSKAGLQVPRKRPRKRVAPAPRPAHPSATHRVWCYDFVHDACANGQVLKCLTVVDEYTRECLAIDVAGSIRSARVIEVLSRLMCIHGKPHTLRSDNGPEFVSNALLQWVKDAKLGLALIEPGKPWQNGTNESFNGKFRDECLSMEWFRSRREANVVIEDWRKHYNSVRPHSSLDYLTPEQFKKSGVGFLTNRASVSM